MIFLRDFQANFNKKYVFLGLLFGILGIVVSTSPTEYSTPLSIFFFILSFLFVLFANRFNKQFEGHFEEKITLKDTFHAVQRDKDGNIKTERRRSS